MKNHQKGTTGRDAQKEALERAPALQPHSKSFSRVGYRPKKISGAIFKMNEKYKGLQLAFSTTVVSDEFKKNKIHRSYFKFYFTPFFFTNLIDSITKKFIPL